MKPVSEGASGRSSSEKTFDGAFRCEARSKSACQAARPNKSVCQSGAAALDCRAGTQPSLE